jgi:amidohydrolase
MSQYFILIILCLLSVTGLYAQRSAGQISLETYAEVDRLVAAVEPRVIAWRRDFHQYPELSNREFRTAEKVAAHLRSLGLEVHTGIAKTGVVGVLKGGKPGPVLGLRADMDALPVSERVDLTFKSIVRTEYNGEQVGVMHACGHDSHMAILMGAAEVLSAVRDQLSGTVVFVFQPAEEGPPEGEEGGASLMVKEGLIERFGIEAMFGLHINAQTEVGTITYRPGGIMAASDWLYITVHGKQSHGSQPWSGVDPIVVSAQIIDGLQTIVSRQVDLTEQPAVITIGKIDAGVRPNIIPEKAELTGTIRTLDTAMQNDIHERIRRTAELIAESAGARAEVRIQKMAPVNYNDPDLTLQMLPALQKAAGVGNVRERKPMTGAEDFAFYGKKVPTLFFFLGGMPNGIDPKDTPAHHTPDFHIDESGMLLGVRAFSYLVMEYFGK